jgi:hypothetical protein
VSDIERTILKLDPIRFAAGEECYGLLVHKCHVPQIEHQRLPRGLDDEQLLELLDILHLHPAAESEHHLTVCRSLDSEHKAPMLELCLVDDESPSRKAICYPGLRCWTERATHRLAARHFDNWRYSGHSSSLFTLRYLTKTKQMGLQETSSACGNADALDGNRNSSEEQDPHEMRFQP